MGLGVENDRGCVDCLGGMIWWSKYKSGVFMIDHILRKEKKKKKIQLNSTVEPKLTSVAPRNPVECRRLHHLGTPSDRVCPRRQCADGVQQVQQKYRSEKVCRQPGCSGENLAENLAEANPNEAQFHAFVTSSS